jgi:2-polyprenyl-3-methyl-5-hydroxy-6-metoxy-1,4-benzoquinol methylase
MARYVVLHHSVLTASANRRRTSSRSRPNLNAVDQSRAFCGDGSAARWFAGQPGWWESHYVDAVDEIVNFLARDGLSLEGRRVLDLGCGDGIISLGLASRSPAGSVIGLDLEPVDMEFLASMAAQHGVAIEQPGLTFGVTQNEGLAIPDDSVDIVITWSVFEHVSNIPGLLAEIRRVLVPGGLLFVQIWPLFFSEHGSHLWQWFDEPFSHLRLDDEEFRSQLRTRVGSQELAEAMLGLYASCNRLTLDQLGSALIEAGFYIGTIETDRAAVHIPPELQHMKLSLLTTAGLKLIAVAPHPRT